MRDYSFASIAIRLTPCEHGYPILSATDLIAKYLMKCTPAALDIVELLERWEDNDKV